MGQAGAGVGAVGTAESQLALLSDHMGTVGSRSLPQTTLSVLARAVWEGRVPREPWPVRCRKRGKRFILCKAKALRLRSSQCLSVSRAEPQPPACLQGQKGKLSEGGHGGGGR